MDALAPSPSAARTLLWLLLLGSALLGSYLWLDLGLPPC
jgi:hypothetical protein